MLLFPLILRHLMFFGTKNGAARTQKPESAVGALWSRLGKPTVAVLYLLTQVLPF